jgi:hypothetical protein
MLDAARIGGVNALCLMHDTTASKQKNNFIIDVSRWRFYFVTLAACFFKIAALQYGIYRNNELPEKEEDGITGLQKQPQIDVDCRIDDFFLSSDVRRCRSS